jgi:hypothetical protein
VPEGPSSVFQLYIWILATQILKFQALISKLDFKIKNFNIEDIFDVEVKSFDIEGTTGTSESISKLDFNIEIEGFKLRYRRSILKVADIEVIDLR